MATKKPKNDSKKQNSKSGKDKAQTSGDFPTPTSLRKAQEDFISGFKNPPKDSEDKILPFPCIEFKDEISQRQNFDQIDQHALQVPKELYLQPMDELLDYLTEPAENEIGKVRVVFRWLADQDIEEVIENDKADLDSVLIHLLNIKKGHLGYTQLFAELLETLDLQVKTIDGYLKGAKYKPGVTIDDSFTGSWVAVFADGSWRLVDPLWGARHHEEDCQIEREKDLSDDESIATETNVMAGLSYKCNEFYFMTDPWNFIFTHFPKEEPEWQLLAKPVTFSEFQNLAYLKPLCFDIGMTLESHKTVEVTVEQGEVEVILGIPPNSDCSFLCKMFAGKEGKKNAFKGTHLDRFLYLEPSLEQLLCKFRFPRKEKYRFELYGINNEEDPDETDYSLVLVYIFNVVNAKDPCEPFPDTTSPEWGVKRSMDDLDMTPLTHKSGYIKTETGEVEIHLGLARNNMKVFHQLQQNKYKDGELNKFSMQHIENDQVIFSLRLPSVGEYAFEVFAKDGKQDDEGYQNVATYLIDCVNCKEETETFPELPNGALGVTEDGAELEVFPVSHPKPMIQLPADSKGQLEIVMGHNQPVHFITDLNLQDQPDSSSCSEYVNICKESNAETSFQIKFPKTGKYHMAMFAKHEQDSEDFVNVFNYFIEVDTSCEQCLPFPQTYEDWQPHFKLIEPNSGILPAKTLVYFKAIIPGANKVTVIGDEWTFLQPMIEEGKDNKKNKKKNKKNPGDQSDNLDSFTWQGYVETQQVEQLKLSANLENDPNSFSTLATFKVVSEECIKEIKSGKDVEEAIEEMKEKQKEEAGVKDSSDGDSEENKEEEKNKDDQEASEEKEEKAGEGKQDTGKEPSKCDEKVEEEKENSKPDENENLKSEDNSQEKEKDEEKESEKKRAEDEDENKEDTKNENRHDREQEDSGTGNEDGTGKRDSEHDTKEGGKGIKNRSHVPVQGQEKNETNNKKSGTKEKAEETKQGTKPKSKNSKEDHGKTKSQQEKDKKNTTKPNKKGGKVKSNKDKSLSKGKNRSQEKDVITAKKLVAKPGKKSKTASKSKNTKNGNVGKGIGQKKSFTELHRKFSDREKEENSKKIKKGSLKEDLSHNSKPKNSDGRGSKENGTVQGKNNKNNSPRNLSGAKKGSDKIKDKPSKEMAGKENEYKTTDSKKTGDNADTGPGIMREKSILKKGTTLQGKEKDRKKSVVFAQETPLLKREKTIGIKKELTFSEPLAMKRERSLSLKREPTFAIIQDDARKNGQPKKQPNVSKTAKRETKSEKTTFSPQKKHKTAIVRPQTSGLKNGNINMAYSNDKGYYEQENGNPYTKHSQRDITNWYPSQGHRSLQNNEMSYYSRDQEKTLQRKQQEAEWKRRQSARRHMRKADAAEVEGKRQCQIVDMLKWANGKQEEITKRKKMASAMTAKMVTERLRAASGMGDRQVLEDAIWEFQSFKPKIPDKKGDLKFANKTLDFMVARDSLIESLESKNPERLIVAMKNVEEKGYKQRLQLEMMKGRHIVMSMERIQNLRNAVTATGGPNWTEVRRYSTPHPVVHQVIMGALLLLGDHEGITSEWINCQALLNALGPTGIFRRINAFDVDKINPEIAARAKVILESVDTQKIKNITCGLERFYHWARGMVDEFQSRNRRLDLPEPADLERQKEILLALPSTPRNDYSQAEAKGTNKSQPPLGVTREQTFHGNILPSIYDWKQPRKSTSIGNRYDTSYAQKPYTNHGQRAETVMGHPPIRHQRNYSNESDNGRKSVHFSSVTPLNGMTSIRKARPAWVD